MASFTSCIIKHKLGGKVMTAELRDTAREYEARGLAPDAAMIRAVEEKIDLLKMEERRIIQAVRAAYEGEGGKKKQDAPIPETAQQSVTKPSSVKNARITPMDHPGLNDDIVRADLERMAQEAGWDEIGGRMLREVANDPNSPVVGRTRWIPRAAWYAALSERLNDRDTERAVKKALSGQPMTSKEKRVISQMIDLAQDERRFMEESANQGMDEQEDISFYADQFDDVEAAYAADLMLDPPLEGGIPMNHLSDEEIDALFGLQTTAADGRQAQEDPAQQTRQGAEGTGAQGQSEPVLESYSREEVIARQESASVRKKQQDAERARQDAERKQEQDKKEIATRMDASAENFQLGQSAEDALSGQQDLLGNVAKYDQRWMDNDMTGLADRAKRVAYARNEHRLPNLKNAVPAGMVPKQASQEIVTVYRGVPSKVKGATIRPGDWVSLSKKHASEHGTGETGRNTIVEMQVPAEDVAWAGTDMNEFFYVPKSLHKDGETALEMLNRLGPEAFSYGKLLGNVKTDTEAFKKWFGDSKVVDADGKPLVVYHGTASDFAEFDPERAGEFGDRFADALFFTSDTDVAASYSIRLDNSEDFRQVLDEERESRNRWAKIAVEDGTKSVQFEEARAQHEEIVNRRRKLSKDINTFKAPTTGANVMPVYLSLQNPLEIDAEGKLFFRVHKDVIDKAIAGNHDGVIIRNVVDTATVESRKPADVFVAFRPEQVKSATGNNGNFNPNDPSILGKQSTSPAIAPFDQSLYDDIGAGKSAAEILSRIAAESDNALNREMAQALIDVGINPKVIQETAAGKRFAIGSAQKGYVFSAAYSPKTDTVMLFMPQEAERNALHEFVHAGTFKALRKGGQAALNMKQLYAHVKKSGQAEGMYGMSNLDEFTAEALSNPEFQALLRSITAMPQGSKFANAWDWFVDLVRRALGLPTKNANALDQALRYGRGLMAENGAESGLVLPGKSAMPEGGPNGNATNAKSIANLLESESFRLKGLSGLEVPAQREVLNGVISLGNDLKVLRSVVKLIPVDVMNILAKKNLSPESLFSDKSVLKNLLSVDSNGSVSTAVNVADALVSAVTSVATKNSVASSRMSGRGGEGISAIGAGVINGLHSGNISEIKAIGNNGNFDPNEPSILGSVNRMPDWLKSMPKETQDAAKKAGIWQEQKPLKQRLKELRDKAVAEFQQGMVDQFAPLKELGEREYVLARLTKSADAPLEAVLLYGKPFLNKAGAVDVNIEKGGLIRVLQQLQGEHDRFFAWIAGNRAAKLKLQGKENLFSDTDISALKNLANGKMADGKDRATLYKLVHQQFNGYSKSVLDIAEKAGIINGDDRAIWETDFYVPFYRVMEDEGFKGPKNVSGMVNQYAFKKLKGGTDNLNDLMQNTLRNWGHLLSASLKNQAATAAINSAVKAGIATEVSQKQKGSVSILGRKVDKIPKGQKYMEGGVEKVSDGSAEVETFGEKHYMIDDPLIMDSITSLEFAGFNNPAMKAMTKAKHYLTLGVTISPTFKIRNLMRDQLAAVAVNPVSYNMMSNLVDGWKGTDKDSEQYAKMLTGGGLMRFGTFLEDDRAAHMKRLINAGVDKKTILDSDNKAKAALVAAWDWWQEVGDRSENITRAAIYKQRYEQLIADGKSADEAHLMASFAARDSMDFSLQGKWGTIRFLTQLVPFMNARLQGLYKIGRDGVMPTGRMIAPRMFGDAKTGDRAKAMRFGAVVGAVSLASVALMLAYRDDEDYQEREEWDKDAFWWFKIGDTAYRIPKPFEVGAIGTIAERGLDTILNGLDKPSRELFVERMWAMLTQTFAMNPMPQLFKPMVDLYANNDSFTNRPIETPGMEKLSKSERIGPNTSATAQFVGKATSAIGISPTQVDFLVNGYFSWLGTHAVMTADFAMRPLMGLPEKPTRKWPDDYFVVGDFAKGLPSNQSKYVTKFYEQAKEVQEAMADIRYYQSMGNLEKAMELRQENADKVKLAEMYAQASRQIGELNKRIKLIQSRNIDPDDKREQIDLLNQRRNRLAKLIEERRLARQKAN